MDFAEIERARRAARLSQYALCHAAGVHPTTYWRLLRRPDSGRARTIALLRRGLARLTTEPRPAAEPQKPEMPR
ncbi:MAG: hypothetical protein HZA68_13085 [Rhodovulum sp.]|nr:hypothetical protein [Rhodovulum sp.]